MTVATIVQILYIFMFWVLFGQPKNKLFSPCFVSASKWIILLISKVTIILNMQKKFTIITMWLAFIPTTFFFVTVILTNPTSFVWFFIISSFTIVVSSFFTWVCFSPSAKYVTSKKLTNTCWLVFLRWYRKFRLKCVFEWIFNTTKHYKKTLPSNGPLTVSKRENLILNPYLRWSFVDQKIDDLYMEANKIVLA